MLTAAVTKSPVNISHSLRAVTVPLSNTTNFSIQVVVNTNSRKTKDVKEKSEVSLLPAVALGHLHESPTPPPPPTLECRADVKPAAVLETQHRWETALPAAPKWYTGTDN